MNITRAVAEHIASETPEHLSADIVESLKICLLDWLAVTLAGSKEDLSDIIARSIEAGQGTGDATVIGWPMQASPLMAALMNGTAAHVLDFDDVHEEEPGHPGAVINSAAYAVAESLDASGRQLLEAIAAGIHVMFVVNSGMMPEHYNSGWHNTGTLGHMGSTAATAKLLGLDANQCVNALGIAGIQMAGLRASFGNMGKPFHGGKAAMNGVLAGLLASNGFVGPQDIIGGKEGLLHVMTPKPRPERILSTLSGDHQVRFLRYKSFPSCLATHATIENAIAIHAKHGPAPQDIKKVTCIVYPRVLEIAAIENPSTGLEAKFSTKFCGAAALINGQLGLDLFNAETATSPEVVSLMAKTHLVPEESYLENRSARMVVEMKDGSQYSHFTNLKEVMADPGKQRKDVMEKYRTLAPTALKKEAVEPVLELVMKIDSLPSIKELSRYLRMVNA